MREGGWLWRRGDRGGTFMSSTKVLSPHNTPVKTFHCKPYMRQKLIWIFADGQWGDEGEDGVGRKVGIPD